MRTQMLGKTGFEPNILALSRNLYDMLIDHPDIIDRIKYSSSPGAPAMAGIDTLTRVFELDEILVSNAIVNSAVEGATASHDFIIKDCGLLLYRPPSAGLMTPAAGYKFSWTGLSSAYNNLGTAIYRYRMDWLRSDRVEIECAYDYKLVATDMGCFFSSVL
jgi:hypothetical protein